ncbi:hypothetical protein SODALDRAFT_20525 [Sodiomyces alkalinus F11]|uniref:Uncharacterized protein n=1 Tax=Sodiomyces alkalinus (strain CBS 110278 / VKM F-3762 / F11) TaxID=1314773 RepID=A0A3N2Q7A9_SODAK|nr:hypothetical protein SODALDRAFT_20525 [Sodiomyces alkalinus F11]ROT42659.1 hypothetical protein SODALDRAFT_20525 [Sodiomyces alkalinus F11]
MATQNPAMARSNSPDLFFTPARHKQLDAIESKYQLISEAQEKEYTQARATLLAAAREEAGCLANRSDIPVDIDRKMRELMSNNLDLRLNALISDFERKTADCEKERKAAVCHYLREEFKQLPKAELKRSGIALRNDRSTPRDGSDESINVGSSASSANIDQEVANDGLASRQKTTATPKSDPTYSSGPRPEPSLVTPTISNAARPTLPKRFSVGGIRSARNSSVHHAPVPSHPHPSPRPASVGSQERAPVSSQKKARSVSFSSQASVQSGSPPKRKSTSALEPSAQESGRTKRPKTASDNPQGERTVTYDEVYQDGKAKYKHAILGWEGQWYILKCEEHGVHFRMQAINAAMKHLDSEAHGKLKRYSDRAVRMLGYRVLGCNEELAEKHNAIVKEAFENGYTPLGMNMKGRCKQPETQDSAVPGAPGATSLPTATGMLPISGNAQALEGKSAIVAANPSRVAQKHANKHMQKGLGIITNPRAGELYFATPRTKPGERTRRYVVMILAWKDLTPCGYGGTTLGSLSLLRDAHRQACYRYDQDGIARWAPGYEDGGKSVKNRFFPVLWFERKSTREGWVRAVELSNFPMYPVPVLGPDHPEMRARAQHKLGRQLMRAKGAKGAKGVQVAVGRDEDPDATDCDSDSDVHPGETADRDGNVEIPTLDDEDDMDYEYEDVASNPDSITEDLPSTATTPPPATSFVDLTTPSRLGAAAGTRLSARKTTTDIDVLMSNAPGRGPQPSPSIDRARERHGPLSALKDGRPTGTEKPSANNVTSGADQREEDTGLFAEAEPRESPNGRKEDQEGEREKLQVRLGTPVPLSLAEEEERRESGEREASHDGKGDKVSEKCEMQQKSQQDMRGQNVMAPPAISTSDAPAVDGGKEENSANDAGQTDREPVGQPQQHQPQRLQSRQNAVTGGVHMQPPQTQGANHSGPSAEVELGENRPRFLQDLAKHSRETTGSRDERVPRDASDSQAKDVPAVTARPGMPGTPNSDSLGRRHSDWAASSGWMGNPGELARRAVRRPSDTPPDSRYSPGTSAPRGQSPFAVVKSEPDALDLCAFRQGARQWEAGSAADAARLRVDEIGGVARAKEGTAEEIIVDPRRVLRFQYNRSRDRSRHEVVLHYGERPEEEQRLILETRLGRSKMQGLRLVKWLRDVNPRVVQLAEVILP